jgi:hypothetical protein
MTASRLTTRTPPATRGNLGHGVLLTTQGIHKRAEIHFRATDFSDGLAVWVDNNTRLSPHLRQVRKRLMQNVPDPNIRRAMFSAQRSAISARAR